MAVSQTSIRAANLPKVSMNEMINSTEAAVFCLLATPLPSRAHGIHLELPTGQGARLAAFMNAGTRRSESGVDALTFAEPRREDYFFGAGDIPQMQALGDNKLLCSHTHASKQHENENSYISTCRERNTYAVFQHGRFGQTNGATMQRCLVQLTDGSRISKVSWFDISSCVVYESDLHYPLLNTGLSSSLPVGFELWGP